MVVGVLSFMGACTLGALALVKPWSAQACLRMQRTVILVLVLGFVGAAGGYVASWWFQGGLVKLTGNLGEYLTDIGRILDGVESVRNTALTGIVLGGIAGVAAGVLFGRRRGQG
jgi:hypothetical protein